MGHSLTPEAELAAGHAELMRGVLLSETIAYFCKRAEENKYALKGELSSIIYCPCFFVNDYTNVSRVHYSAVILGNY